MLLHRDFSFFNVLNDLHESREMFPQTSQASAVFHAFQFRDKGRLHCVTISALYFLIRSCKVEFIGMDAKPVILPFQRHTVPILYFFVSLYRVRVDLVFTGMFFFSRQPSLIDHTPLSISM